MSDTIPQPVVLVVMGVSGCGKTTVATLLAARLNWPFMEGDALHSAANIEKMQAGIPLDDNDRAPWLECVAAWAEQCLDAGRCGVITCSALRRAYRDIINRRGQGIIFVHLAGSKALIQTRVAARKGHFMPASLLDSQFADLQEPGPDEPALRVDASDSSSEVVQVIVQKLGLAPMPAR